jgi:hypothetical protein
MKTKSIAPLNDEGIMPLDPKDAAALVVVRKVLDWMAETGDWTYTHAFEGTGVDYWNFYRAYKRPAVQAAVADWLGELNVATAAMLRKRWLQVMAHMTDIATGGVGDPRAAVQAARFLDGVRQQVGSQSEGEKGQGEQSVAARMLQRFVTPTRLRRTTVVEEVELAPDDEHTGAVIEG